MENNILLDSTSGELEIMEFTVRGVQFGVNVSKVQEIIKPVNVVSIPMAPDGVAGMINVRDSIYTVIDLNKILFGNDTVETNKTCFILTNFNNLRNAFIVDDVSSIDRCEWKSIIKPDAILDSDKSNVIGIITFEDRIISLIDFEAIVSRISPDLGLKVDDVYTTDNLIEKRKNHTILVADDSKMLNKLLCNTISSAGYQIVSVDDGAQSITKYKENPKLYSLLVTDIEMPVMDGLESAKVIREMNPSFPIIAFSSLVNDTLRAKVANLKLNDMITKPEIGALVSKIDELVL